MRKNSHKENKQFQENNASFLVVFFFFFSMSLSVIDDSELKINVSRLVQATERKVLMKMFFKK